MITAHVHIQAMHIVAVVALPSVISFDLATPSEVFGRLRLPDGTAAYELRVCGPQREVDAGGYDVRVRHGLSALAKAHTIMIPGIVELDMPLPEALLSGLRRAYARGARIASICTGAFVLAASGLLDGLRATTHWLAADELARRFPRVQVDPNVLYVDNGQILTAAGAAAGLDLCLHMVRRDFGAKVAAHAARLAVMPLERQGGQAQFIVHEPPRPEPQALSPLLDWIERNLERDLTLQVLAKKAAMSTRTLSRRFLEQTGTTPLKWVHHARVRRAQALLEGSKRPVESVAQRVGFGSAAVLRQHFRRFVGTSPAAYQKAFGAHALPIRRAR